MRIQIFSKLWFVSVVHVRMRMHTYVFVTVQDQIDTVQTTIALNLQQTVTEQVAENNLAPDVEVSRKYSAAFSSSMPSVWLISAIMIQSTAARSQVRATSYNT